MARTLPELREWDVEIRDNTGVHLVSARVRNCRSALVARTLALDSLNVHVREAGNLASSVTVHSLIPPKEGK